MTRRRPVSLPAKIAAAAVPIALAEGLIDGVAMLLPLAGLGWIAVLLATRPAVRRLWSSRIALAAAGLFALVELDDPGPLALLLFLVAITLAAMLPRRRFDDALAWGLRLGWAGAMAVLLPARDWLQARQRSRRPGVRIAAVAATLALPLGGGALFLWLFASANPLIAGAFAGMVLPDSVTVIWRGALALVVLVPVWATLRPPHAPTGWDGRWGESRVPAVGTGTLLLSLVTFNTIFAIQNALDVAFLWSGAALPAGVTMADYAHRGAYALIVTALLAGLFVLVTLRPGSAGAAHRGVRTLVTLWILQNLLLVASSALRTLDYVAAYSMTALRLAALIWMALVALGLALILWRLLANRSAAWLINTNALAAALVLTICTVVDLGAVAAAWNVRVALARGPGAPLDTCYLESLGASALVPLARFERATRDAVLHDAATAIRWNAQVRAMDGQASWNSRTWRNARRLDAVAALVGTDAPRLRPAPGGRACGMILPVRRAVQAAPTRLTKAPQR